MTPEPLSIADVIARLRRAAAERQGHTARFSFHMNWLRQEIVATVDAGRSDLILRHDIQHLLGSHQRDFDEGWRKHPILPNCLLYLVASDQHGIPRWFEGFWPREARRN